MAVRKESDPQVKGSLGAKPNIYSYQDHNKFLSDWIEYRKSKDPKFSLRALAKQAGLALGYLPMVMNGQRPLSAAALIKMKPFLKLNAAELSFLECLHVIGTSKQHEARFQALEKMKKFSQFRDQESHAAAFFQYITHWHYIIIREMATLPDFQEDPEWIQKQIRFTIPLNEIKNAIEFLLEHRFLEKSDDGKIIAPTEALVYEGELYRLALAEFHREILRVAGDAVEKIPVDERKFMGHTCSLNAKNYEKAKRIVEKAIQSIRELGSDDHQAESVYHLEVALFPMTISKGSTK